MLQTTHGPTIVEPTLRSTSNRTREWLSSDEHRSEEARTNNTGAAEEQGAGGRDGAAAGDARPLPTQAPSSVMIAAGTSGIAHAAVSVVQTGTGLLSASPPRHPPSTSGTASPEPDYYTAVSGSSDGGSDEEDEVSEYGSGSESQVPGVVSTIPQSGIVHLGPTPGTIPPTQRTVDFSDDPAWAESAREAAEARGETEEERLVVTHKLEHVEMADGHHVVTGREGKLLKCEDEPIRTPGAIQAFGVLIAVEEDFESDTLIVRQVSENSKQILNLSPKYLFELPCLSDVLPDAEADLLFDNIQFLNNLSGDQDDGPQVFLLSGWGEPGTASRRDPSPGPDGRASWTCWCAAHRPTPVTNSDGATDTSQLVILEFELERDVHNPLYPPFDETAFESGIPSPSSRTEGSSAQSSGTGSTRESVGTEGSSAPESTGTGGSAQVSTGSSGLASAANASSPGTSVSGSSLSHPSLGSRGSDSSAQTLISTDSSPRNSSPFGVVEQGRSLSGSTAAELSSSRGGDNRSPRLHLGNAGGHLRPFMLPHLDESWMPHPQHILESTTNRAKPLLALERLRRMSRAAGADHAPLVPSLPPIGERPGAGRRARGRRGGAAANGVGMMDIFAIMTQINEQLGAAEDLETFLKICVGVIKDVTQFHRVLIYQFDEVWNGQVVAELVDWHQTHDLYMGLHFPASDIPAQARELYAINKVRTLYDRDQPTARLVVRDRSDLEQPLNMTHCYLRAMSPIHLKCKCAITDLGNMGVRASMSISIMAFGTLWGLVACHSYGPSGMRVSFLVRQMLRLLSQSISRNIERLSYARRLHTRKLINTATSDQHPTGYIVSNADDLLQLFDADYGMLVVGQGAKIIGPNQNSQEILVVAEYLRLKRYTTVQVSQALTADFPDLELSTGLEVIAGLLYVPLSTGGKDFIAFLRKGQPREVHWAGRPHKEDVGDVQSRLEPRTSFKVWSQVVAGRSRQWTDEQLETAGVLALVYGKFIEVWRQKESALQTTKLTNILLSNASHEVRTPLNHIINYLEMAMNGPLDTETRDNLSRSHAASKSLLFTINDLLDLTRLESGHETTFSEPLDLRSTILDATVLYKNEAARRNLSFTVDLTGCPKTVLGDAKKIKTVVANLTANAVKYTDEGGVIVECRTYDETEGLREPSHEVAVEIVVSDTGRGISSSKLESIFREFEQVESVQERPQEGLGLGLAVVARIVEQLGGQLRVDSKIGQGSRFSFLIPFALAERGGASSVSSGSSGKSHIRSRTNSGGSVPLSGGSDIDDLVEALGGGAPSSPSVATPGARVGARRSPPGHIERMPSARSGQFLVTDSKTPVRGVKMDVQELDQRVAKARKEPLASATPQISRSSPSPPKKPSERNERPLRILVVEDDEINRVILSKRLTLSGHTVENTCNGQEGVDKVREDDQFDCILMDVQMPILNGFDATRSIRELEKSAVIGISDTRASHRLNGRLPIFAVSASLHESQYSALCGYGLDGWILKPIDFKRLTVLLRGIEDPAQRLANLYRPGGNWEAGGWLTMPTPKPGTAPPNTSKLT
ncbi:hypothetical protein PUNSTDRAFT_118301 [Punctularia strigosozonata HHB-11173 SS5]|uniref:uncharacterized protein n=1 Tax=Punctularia strigosozonata (strain HHB-11173) TaxID=741275 RepID=UPI0004418354|nr:uncharacterized protein PUNSTDRAFT_118301 [Punctularia strigosozonata HHB-11173 SS5]EIN12484.1 hypothetical protein PUNSTDRAFT_118301 [Punctularia strigosozonata HHB-11173 SS5]